MRDPLDCRWCGAKRGQPCETTCLRVHHTQEFHPLRAFLAAQRAGDEDNPGDDLSGEAEAMRQIGIIAIDGTDPVALCIEIQNNTTRIPVRVNLDGEWKNLFLSEMPSSLAVWWALEFVKRHLLKERT